MHGNGLGPEPVLAASGTIDLSGYTYRALSGAVVRGGAQQRMVVCRQGRLYYAHAWSHGGKGTSVRAAVDDLLAAIDYHTTREVA